ncbi:alpha/beta hydrolase [Halpernia frigidisoli]|uniref:Acetyl esterase/lipase n=1 Tax=Halpernia frigidisoli TaxID=1125876 RepID=A0A1I3IVV6_9FLAO|nr:alpha/beta hydrolase [Halpernia frigidisoli]SFI52037.1 Acetyl esterase/lipase [Halpernia frigidisoli]
MLKLITFFQIFSLITWGNAQVVKDTTFTDHSEYVKTIKKYSFIIPVEYKKSENIVFEKDLIYKSENGRDLHFDALLNKEKENYPAVILIHGGGWKSGDKKMMYPLAENLAENGYNCFEIEYRLSDEVKYPGGVDDVINAIKFIKKNKKKFNINSNKIAILGVSSGGQMAALIGNKYPDLVNAIVDIDGILAFHHPESAEGKVAALWLGGTYEEKPKIWEEASASNHVSVNSPPILFLNSQNVRFHAGRDDMIEKLKEFSVDCHVVTIPETPHTFWIFHPWFEETTYFINSFLDQKLKTKSKNF